jgi:CheY-like chemotaxis protein
MAKIALPPPARGVASLASGFILSAASWKSPANRKRREANLSSLRNKAPVEGDGKDGYTALALRPQDLQPGWNHPMSFKILVVEDNTDTRELLRFYFTNEGYAVTTAVDGLEGLYMARAIKPDLILTDIAMPMMEGIEMIRQIRSETETGNIPILVFTAHGLLLAEEAIEAGANQAFDKPFDFNELGKVVRAWLVNPLTINR